jgi:hypothetical protein
VVTSEIGTFRVARSRTIANWQTLGRLAVDFAPILTAAVPRLQPNAWRIDSKMAALFCLRISP